MNYASKSVYIQEENKHEISPDLGTKMKSISVQSSRGFPHYRSDYGDVWAVWSHMVRRHTPQHRCIVFRMVLLSVMGFCVSTSEMLEAQQRLFLAWTAYSN